MSIYLKEAVIICAVLVGLALAANKVAKAATNESSSDAEVWTKLKNQATTVAQMELAQYLENKCSQQLRSQETRDEMRTQCIQDTLIDLHVRATPIFVLDQDAKALGVSTGVSQIVETQ